MKKYILLFLLPFLLINLVGKSQDTIGISSYSAIINNDTLPGGSTDSISFWVVNKGSTIFSDYISFLTYVQDSAGSLFHIADTISASGPYTIAPGDSLPFSINPFYDVVTPNKYHYDINVIVIWPVAFTANTSDVLTYVEYLTIPAGVAEINLGRLIKVYPNPTTDKLTIENGGINAIEEVRIYDSAGQMVKVINNESIINTESWCPGIYIIDITITNQKRQRLKILKQ